jgi:hypothetical protein
MCEVEGCSKPINRDGVCFAHKLATIRFSAASLKNERNGSDATGGTGTREYVQRMYAKRRADGMADPIPENAKAARFAPAAGPMNNNRKYRAANGGI